MKNICVIGTGISGATIANLLSKNFIVEVYDKAKGIGGRSSYRRYLSEIGFDHGLQYMVLKEIILSQNICLKILSVISNMSY